MTQPAPYAPVVVQRPHPAGMPGVRLSGAEVAERIGRHMRDPAIIAWSRRTIAAANLPMTRGKPEPTPIVQCLFAAIKKLVAFVKDPLGTELMIGARELLCLNDAGERVITCDCSPAGDCDDQLIVLGSCAMSVGIPVRLRIRRYAGQDQAHITMLYDSNRRLGGPWLCIDPSTEDGTCSNAPYAEEFTLDVNPGGGELMFIGVGDPEGAGTLGDAPATLPADQAAAWLAQVQIAHDTLDASRAALSSMSAAYGKVRADLGLAAFDAPAEGTSPSTGTTPLSAYGQSGTWTAAAQQAETQLLGVAAFIEQCLADGIAGARPLAFDQGDVLVGTLAGDPYRVVLQTPAGGAGPVPTIVDAQGNVQGTLGLIQFLVGAGVVAACTIAVAYAVSKICDYLAQKHHDDALTRISDNQTELVASGKETPQQAAAQVQAMGDLAAASNVTNPPSSGLSGFAGLAVAVVLGIAVGVGADRAIGMLTARRAA